MHSIGDQQRATRRGLARAGLLLAGLWLAFAVLAAPARRIEIVYVGADDCFYCQHWEAARKPELLETLRGTGARLIEVHGETLAQPITERHYPPALRWLYREVGDLRGVPRFFLVIDGRIELRVLGTNAYSTTLVPRLNRALSENR